MSSTELNGFGEADPQPSIIHDMFSRDVRPLLDLIDDIRSLGIEQDIKIRQIVAIGDQSSGKSSVLEALSGVSFPHSARLETRCVTQVTMKRSLAGEWRGNARVSWDDEQPPGAGPIEKPEDVVEVITKLTQALVADSGASFSYHSIIIEIESPDVSDLTIIDVPGIIRTTVQGQSQDSIRLIEKLVEKFVKQERTDILAVVPAHQDIATIDVLEKAQQHDPNGERTIAVLTKMDLVEDEACQDVMKLVQNEVKPMTMGYCALKNQSSRNGKQVPIQQAKRKELNFFKSHPVFSKLDTSLYGIDSLTERLVKILVRRIHESLPQIREELTRILTITNGDIEALGEGPPLSYSERCAVFHQYLTRVYDIFQQASSGDYDREIFRQNDKVDALFLDKNVDGVFQRLDADIGKRPDTSDEKFKTRLRTRIRQYRNRRNIPFLYPKPVFKFEVCEFIEDWPKHANNACDIVVQASKDAIDIIASKELSSFPQLQSVMLEHARKLVDRFAEVARDMLKHLIQYERDPFTRDREFNNLLFSSKRDGSSSGNDPINSDHLDPAVSLQTDERLAEVIAEQLSTYWSVARRRYLDYSCLILRSEIVDATTKELLPKLLSVTSNTDALERMFAERPDIQYRRDTLNEKKGRLSSALEKINLSRFNVN